MHARTIYALQEMLRRRNKQSAADGRAERDFTDFVDATIEAAHKEVRNIRPARPYERNLYLC